MKRKKEIKYLNKHWEKMQGSFKSFISDDDPEQLHKFRVEIKKLKAMLLLMEDVMSAKRLLKQFKPVQKIFKIAGEIRDAQIHLSLAGKYQLNNEDFKLAESSKAEQAAENFKANAPYYLKRMKQARRRVKSRLRAVPDKSIAKFYKGQLKQIANGLATPHFDDGLHDCRKQLKVLMYNHHLAGDALEHRIAFNQNYVNDLQSKIGDWHDHALSITLFDSDQLRKKTVISKVKREHLKIEKDILATSQDFLSKVKEPVTEEVKK